jgi:hypothetical protein
VSRVADFHGDFARVLRDQVLRDTGAIQRLLRLTGVLGALELQPRHTPNNNRANTGR